MNPNFVDAAIERLLGPRRGVSDVGPRDRRGWREIPDVLPKFLEVEGISLRQREYAGNGFVLVTGALAFSGDYQRRLRRRTFKRSDEREPKQPLGL